MPQDDQSLVRQLQELGLVEVSSHALVLLNPAGIIAGWLAGAERMFGYTPGEIVGSSVSVLFTTEDLQRGQSEWELKTATESGESEDDRWQVRQDGARIWVSGTLTAIRDEQGQLVGFVKIMRNRTDQKLHVDALESRIASLQQARERKNNFISTLAHELRSPLAAVVNAAQLIEHSIGNLPASTLPLGMIRRQAEFMGRMIDDLLEVARMAAGKVQMRRERVDLCVLIGDAVETCRPAIDERGQRLQQLLPEVPIPLEADPVRVRQVFVNLLGNASKYTEPGGTISIKASTEGENAVVRVQDTGIGIAPEIMPHIFDLFTQAERTSESQGGLGIGLSLVRDAVALHGGNVQAISDGVGKGSEFIVRLPLPTSGTPGAGAPAAGEWEKK